MSRNNVEFDLTARRMTVRERYNRNAEPYFIDFSDIVSKSIYRRGEKYFIDIIVKDFKNPIRTINYDDDDHERDRDDARLSLIFAKHF